MKFKLDIIGYIIKDIDDKTHAGKIAISPRGYRFKSNERGFYKLLDKDKELWIKYHGQLY